MVAIVHFGGNGDATGRRRYVYLPGGGPILTSALVSSFRLVAVIELHEDRSAAGIICTQRLGMMDHFTDLGWAL